MRLTTSQEKAIQARGNVLVMAGAGTGKTRTLVERAVNCLLHGDPPASLDELLMVTFTESAAAEMRSRIRRRLEEEVQKLATDANRGSELARIKEQLALFDTANIGTLHSFCLKLIRQHFYELELDPQLSVMPEEEALLLAHEILSQVLQNHYAGTSDGAQTVQRLIQSLGKDDRPVRMLVLRIHRYSQTLPDPEGWMRSQRERFASPDPVDWTAWRQAALQDFVRTWLPKLEQLAVSNLLAKDAAEALKPFAQKLDAAQMGAVFGLIAKLPENCPHGNKGKWLKPLEVFLEDAEFLGSLLAADGKDPLLEDWEWSRHSMLALLQLADEFQQEFSGAKRELGMADFQDLEQYALRLLWDTSVNQPTAIALQWRKQLRIIFVDEYQDINAAQDKIIEALGRADTEANRFLVGDVKQSIYRFRLADPRIFQGYATNWKSSAGQVIPLSDNFRSREGLLNFFNAVFTNIMQEGLGGVAYDKNAQLRFGAPEQRSELAANPAADPRVEFLLCPKTSDKRGGEEEDSAAASLLVDIEQGGREPRQVALRLKQLKAEGHLIWDEEQQSMRPVEWRDMAVLLRAKSGKAEIFAREFARAGVPLEVSRGGFYQSVEISDLVSLLQLLDNPLQDVPTLAVLHSPLVGLNANELAQIRLAAKGHFWIALARWHETESEKAGTTYQKVDRFLKRYSEWRRLARQVSLSRCLEAVLVQTHYAEWLLTLERGEARHANVRRLLALTQQFDQFQRQGLFRFLLFVEAQKEAETEPDVAAGSVEDSVQLMTIHQSKGLEFPVVVLADISKNFNERDLRTEVILDEAYGLSPKVIPPKGGSRFPSLPHWLSSRRQRRELLGEELRLLYVAMTRARDTLILSGAVTPKAFDQKWRGTGDNLSDDLECAHCYADWLAIWFRRQAGLTQVQATEGGNEVLRWSFREAVDAVPLPAEAAADSVSGINPDSKVMAALNQRVTWSYPFLNALGQPAKTSVSRLRQHAAASLQDDAGFQPAIAKKPTPTASPGGTDVGTAHHQVLRWMHLAQGTNTTSLERELERLQQAGRISATDAARVDLAAIASFWNSPTGQKFLAQANHLKRELEFTARFLPGEIASVTGIAAPAGLEDEFMVVQGVADLVAFLPNEIWLLDYKTDSLHRTTAVERARQYEPQLRLYAAALERIYNLPVKVAWLYFLSAGEAVEVDCREKSGRS